MAINQFASPLKINIYIACTSFIVNYVVSNCPTPLILVLSICPPQQNYEINVVRHYIFIETLKACSNSEPRKKGYV